MHCHIAAGPRVNVRSQDAIRRQNGWPKPGECATATTHSARWGKRAQARLCHRIQVRRQDGATPPRFDAADRAAGRPGTLHEEFDDTPVPSTKGLLYVLVGNKPTTSCRRVQDNEARAAQSFFLGLAAGHRPKAMRQSWSIQAASRCGSKHHGGNVTGLDSVVEYFNVTPRPESITGVAARRRGLGKLPHRVHIPRQQPWVCPAIGTTTLGKRCRPWQRARRPPDATLQFHSYGGATETKTRSTSKAPELAAYVNDHPQNITIGPSGRSCSAGNHQP